MITILDNKWGHLKSQQRSIFLDVRQTQKDALSLPTTALCIQISIYSIHVGWGSFRFVQSLDSLISKQSQPHLQSGRILSLSPLVEDLEMAIKWVTAYLIIGPLPFSAGNSLRAAMWKIPRRFSLTVSLTLYCAFTSDGACSDWRMLYALNCWKIVLKLNISHSLND